MTSELLLSLLFCFLAGILSFIFLYSIKKSLPYLPLRFFLFLVAVAILALALGTFDLLPNWIGICFLFLVEAISFAWVIYLAIGVIIVIAFIIVMLVRKRKMIK